MAATDLTIDAKPRCSGRRRDTFMRLTQGIALTRYLFLR
jgi:hypothetical protein